jgi:hypothetical protein
LRGFPGDFGQRPLCGRQRRRQYGRGSPRPDYGQEAGLAAMLQALQQSLGGGTALGGGLRAHLGALLGALATGPTASVGAGPAGSNDPAVAKLAESVQALSWRTARR